MFYREFNPLKHERMHDNKFIAQHFLCIIKGARVTAALGSDICIGIALVKTWRVVYIFKYPKPGKRVSQP